MAARPPPARPHIGISPSFHSPQSADWAEDDAWDSASDSESPRQSTITTSWMQSSLSSSRPPSATTHPKPVPRTPVSSSTLAFSYTHINAPSPSSYPPKHEQPAHQKSGWTIVRRSTEIRASAEEKERDKADEGVDDGDDESEMVVGELDPEINEEPMLSAKLDRDQFSIRDDVDEIVNDPLHGVRHRSFKRTDKFPRRDQSPDLSVDKEASEKLMRERSIRTNRRHKFVDCLSGQDVNIAALRKLAWAGIPSDMRPMSWQLLLVSRSPANAHRALHSTVGLSTSPYTLAFIYTCSQTRRISLVSRAGFCSRPRGSGSANMASN
jgi:hypothetical protein